MTNDLDLHWVDWPAPACVKAVITQRGGPQPQPFGEHNLALHVGDSKSRVICNREYLARITGVEQWQWLDQVHGVDVVKAVAGTTAQADASFTSHTKLALAILTADCLPILMCDDQGTQIAAVHAGWRGLVDGVVVNAFKQFELPADRIMAYIGPAIGGASYEVDQPLLLEFARSTAFSDISIEQYFRPVTDKPGHYLADLSGLARAQLHKLGVNAVYGGNVCTYQQSTRYYSYRRQAITGRFASIIWLEK